MDLTFQLLCATGVGIVEASGQLVEARTSEVENEEAQS